MDTHGAALEKPRPLRALAGGLEASKHIAGALDYAPTGLIILDKQGFVRLVTRRAADLLGLAERLARRTRFSDLVLACRGLEAAGRASLISGLASAGSEAQQVMLTVEPDLAGGMDISSAGATLAVDIRAAGNEGWILSIQDVTQSRQTQDWLLEHVSSDPVTGLWNRQHFMLMLQDCLMSCGAPGSAPSLLLISLPRFKQVTEALGPVCGDALLRMVAGRLSSSVGEDDMQARFAGEEFAVACVPVGTRTAEEFGAHLHHVLSAPYVIENHAGTSELVVLHAHVGIAVPTPGMGDAETLVVQAQLALLEAETGTGTSVRLFDPQLHERAQARRALESDLRLALERHEFELFYQPQVDVAHAALAGLEALIRWRSPVRGLVPPGLFIDLSERLGLIVDIGGWVLRQACRDAMSWPAHLTVAVNASPLQFETGNFAHEVAEALRASGLPAHRLEIEVTENLLMRDTGPVMRTLAALHAMGVRLVLDDFGTGYASFSQLSRFRFDKIKIDRSFVSPPDEAPENRAIVRAIAALGHSLGIPTTAEGVETETQLAEIAADGCTQVQGYFYSRPLPVHDLPGLFARLA